MRLKLALGIDVPFPFWVLRSTTYTARLQSLAYHSLNYHPQKRWSSPPAPKYPKKNSSLRQFIPPVDVRLLSALFEDLGCQLPL